jgi:hypothetical protein|tara:strand:- start:180 stop:404 length:225 start_codon:yes stop_codon:yes gene_type:complete
MAKVELSSTQKKELEQLAVVMVEEAISVKLDYEQSGSNLDENSIVAIHQDSPLLQDEKEKLGEVAFNITPKEKK